jgi:hypothetical protein
MNLKYKFETIYRDIKLFKDKWKRQTKNPTKKMFLYPLIKDTRGSWVVIHKVLTSYKTNIALYLNIVGVDHQHDIKIHLEKIKHKQ